MGTEEHSDFKSIFAKFQDSSGSNFSRNVQQIPTPTISNVRFNPTFLGVISALEGKPQHLPAPISKKPELPAKPSGDSHAVTPILSSSNHSEDNPVVLLKLHSDSKPTLMPREYSTLKPPVPPKSKISSAIEPMKLSKGLKKTLHIHIADSPRSDGDGMCSKSPQVYRQSYPTFMNASPFKVVDNNQDCYEAVGDAPQLQEMVKPKPQMSSFSKKKPPPVLEPKNSEEQDCYESVNDGPQKPGKPSLPIVPRRRSPVPSFTQKKPIKEVEANQSEGADCYEVIDGFPQTQKTNFAHQKSQMFSFSRKNPPPIPKTDDSKGRDCYETVTNAPQRLEKPLAPNIPPRKSPVPFFSQQKFSQVMKANQSEGQDYYDVVLQAKSKPSASFKASKPCQETPVLYQKHSLVTETNQSEGQDYYDDVLQAEPKRSASSEASSQETPVLHHKHLLVTETIQSEDQDSYAVSEGVLQTQARPSPTFNVHSKSQVPADPEMEFNDQDCYDDVDDSFSSQVEPPRPLVYTSSCVDTFPERNQCDGQECYEVIESAVPTELELPPPIIDHAISQQNSSSTISNKSLRIMEGKSPPSSSEYSLIKDDPSPNPCELKIKPKKTIPASKMPKLKLLPPIGSLGPPPPKDSRPPYVDLTPYIPSPPQGITVKDDEAEVSETEYDAEYDLPPSSPAIDEECCYQDARQLNQQDSQSQACETEELMSEQQKADERAESFSRRAPVEGLESDGVLTLQRSTADLPISKEQEAGPEVTKECCYEVSEANSDLSVGDLETLKGSLQGKEEHSKDAKMTKNEQAFRKKFKVSGLEAAMYTTAIIMDCRPEKHTLPMKRGDVVDVIRVTDCPPGKWLVKDQHHNYGFVPVSCVDISRDILSPSPGPGAPESSPESEGRNCDSGLGTDLSLTSDSHSVRSDDLYDDVGTRSPVLSSPGGKGKGFGHFFRKERSRKEDLGSASIAANTTAAAGHGGAEYCCDGDGDNSAKEKESTSWRSMFLKHKEQKVKTDSSKNDGKGSFQVSGKKLAKEEKIFREKFKYTGDINVFSVATISNLAPPTTMDKLELLVKPGETVDVIDVTSEDHIICRNSEGKFGYVRIQHLSFNSHQ